MPAGLSYQPDVLSADEERAVLEELDRLEFDEIRMHGVAAKRTAKHLGFEYDYEHRGLVADAEPMPHWLQPVREKAALLAGVRPEQLVEVLVQRSPEGAQIGWHRDAPMFGTIVGISLLSSARMRFRLATDKRQTAELELQPRSGYVLADEARTKWQHHLPPVKSLRYSITFRTLRHPERYRPS